MDDVEELISSAEEVSSLARSGSETEFAILVDKSVPILNGLITREKNFETVFENPSVRETFESLGREFSRAKGLLADSSLGSETRSKQLENSKDEIEALHGDLMTMSSRLNLNELEECEEEKIGLDEVALKLKYGCEGELKRAALRLSELIKEKSIGSDWIEDEGVIPALFARLSSGKSDHSLILIRLLRALALDNPIDKVSKIK